MARPVDPAVRTLLIERSALLLQRREPLTLRSLVAGTGVSTMAVYTHFGGMDGLWRALRQEGFTRLASRYGGFTPSDDAVADLATLVAAYADNALEHPAIYRAMFDASADLDDEGAADASLGHLVRAVERGRTSGRLRDDVVPLDLALQVWASAHGVVSLVAGGPLPPEALRLCRPVLAALCTAAGDDAGRARSSVEDGWARLALVRTSETGVDA